MNREQLDRIRRMVRKDEKYKRFSKAADHNPALHIPYDELHEELERIHRTRAMRVLTREKRFTEKLIDAMLTDAQSRARCADILSTCLKVTGNFHETLTNLRDYLVIEYSEQLGTRVRTKEERRAFMESVLRPFYRYVYKVEQLEKHARLVVEDIDKAGYTFTNLVNAAKLLGKPESI